MLPFLCGSRSCVASVSNNQRSSSSKTSALGEAQVDHAPAAVTASRQSSDRALACSAILAADPFGRPVLNDIGARAEHGRTGVKEGGLRQPPAQDELAALFLRKNYIGAYQRMYSFLTQMFDYDNTAVEKRFLFFRRLMPLLEFGREREGVDLR